MFILYKFMKLKITKPRILNSRQRLMFNVTHSICSSVKKSSTSPLLDCSRIFQPPRSVHITQYLSNSVPLKVAVLAKILSEEPKKCCTIKIISCYTCEIIYFHCDIFCEHIQLCQKSLLKGLQGKEANICIDPQLACWEEIRWDVLIFNNGVAITVKHLELQFDSKRK